MGVSMTSPIRGRVERTKARSRAARTKPRSRAARRACGWLTCALLAAGCSVDTRPFSNGLVVSVESDLSAPKDLDRDAALGEKHARRVEIPVNERPIVTHGGLGSQPSDEPLKANATNLATAMARLAPSAATIALVPPDALICAECPFPLMAVLLELYCRYGGPLFQPSAGA